MKKLSWYVTRLTLSQQLFALIFIFITFFSGFFFIYMNNKVDVVIQGKAFDDLIKTQAIISQRIRKGESLKTIIINYNIADSSIKNFVLLANNEYYGFIDESLSPPSSMFNKALFEEIIQQAKQAQYLSTTHVAQEEDSVYYAVLRLNESDVLISYTRSEYLQNFKNSLVSSVINITVLVVGFFFLILMSWVASLIHPLNQIRSYIDKVKMGKTPNALRIVRQDEIGEVYDALVSMNNELKRQERIKEDMIHNISHDLKTPIATIKSYGESIKDGIYPYETLEKSVDVIIENAERLEKKVHSLLFMNRVEYLMAQDQGKSKTNMKVLIETVILNIKVIQPQIEIVTNLEEVIFDGIEESWRVAVENILENALRYAVSKIEITLTKQGELTIHNDGPCMDESRIQTLFKPYEKGQGGNFGLGLSIVAKVVQKNHYEVVGENTIDGVIFRIRKKIESITL